MLLKASANSTSTDLSDVKAQEAWFNDQDIAKIDSTFIDKLISQAKQNSRQRMRLCLHKDTSDDVHEMIIAMSKSCYVRPHKHMNKTESFHMIRGSLWLFVFDDRGAVIEKFKMSDNRDNGFLVYRLEKNYWHTIIPISDFVVFHEVRKGPFKGKGDSIFPSWAPKEEEVEKAREFLKKIIRK